MINKKKSNEMPWYEYYHCSLRWICFCLFPVISEELHRPILLILVMYLQNPKVSGHQIQLVILLSPQLMCPHLFCISIGKKQKSSHLLWINIGIRNESPHILLIYIGIRNGEVHIYCGYK